MSGATAEQGFVDPNYNPRQRSNSFGGSGSTRALYPEGTLQENKPEKLQSFNRTDMNGNKVGSVSGSNKGSISSRLGSTSSMNRALAECYLKQTSFASLDQADGDDENQIALSEPKGDDEKEIIEETQWDSKFQYLLALLGWAVGLGNIWRFPYLCYRHGGGAFLIPYLIMLIFEAFPLFFMELLLGQRHRVGSVSLWKKFEYRATGIGCASAIVCVLISLYYNVILSWALYYLYNSFRAELPWSSCPVGENGTAIEECSTTSATEYFYYRETLDFAGWGDSDSVKIVWPILLCNTVLWAVIFFACVKGISSAGKAMYVTVIFPIVILFIFFIRSMTLTGALPGIQYLFKPDLNKIFTKKCWQDAATQTFFNLGLAYGTVISYSSFNPSKNNCQQDALFVATINAIVSVIASLTVFGIIGFKSLLSSSSCFLGYLQGLNQTENEAIASFMTSNNFHQSSFTEENFEYNSNFYEAASMNSLFNTTEFHQCSFNGKLDTFKGGPGLAFIAFSEAISQMGASAPLWAVLFFIMLLMVGISSQIGILLGFLLPIHDSFLVGRIEQSKFTAMTCISMACVGVIFCLRSGLNWVDIFDGYSGTLPLLVIALCEVLVAAWVYGTDKLEEDIFFCCEFKSKLQPYWNICWKFISPAMLFVIIAMSVWDLKNGVSVSLWVDAANNITGTYQAAGMTTTPAPLFAKLCIVLILLIPLGWIPGFFGFFHHKGKKGRYKNTTDGERKRFVVGTEDVFDENDNT